jgi:hypothetical protein
MMITGPRRHLINERRARDSRPRRRGAGGVTDEPFDPGLAEPPYVCRLQALGALVHVEFDLLVLLEVPVSVPLDGTEVHENVRAALLGDEAITLFRVEPLDGSYRHTQSLLSWPDRTSLQRDRRPPAEAGRDLLVYRCCTLVGQEGSTPIGRPA